jgi:hypothetical protein
LKEKRETSHFERAKKKKIAEQEQKEYLWGGGRTKGCCRSCAAVARFSGTLEKKKKKSIRAMNVVWSRRGTTVENIGGENLVHLAGGYQESLGERLKRQSETVLKLGLADRSKEACR